MILLSGISTITTDKLFGGRLLRWTIYQSRSPVILKSLPPSGLYDCKLWDISSQHLQAPGSQPDSHRNTVSSVVFSYNSKYVASFSEESEMRSDVLELLCSSVKLWDAGNGQCVQTIEAQEEPIVFSHTSKLLASVSSNDPTIDITDLCTSNITRAQGHKGKVISIAFSHSDQVLASSSHDCTTKLWNTVNCHCLQTLDQCSIEFEFLLRFTVPCHKHPLISAESLWHFNPRIHEPIYFSSLIITIMTPGLRLFLSLLQTYPGLINLQLWHSRFYSARY